MSTIALLLCFSILVAIACGLFGFLSEKRQLQLEIPAWLAVTIIIAVRGELWWAALCVFGLALALMQFYLPRRRKS